MKANLSETARKMVMLAYIWTSKSPFLGWKCRFPLISVPNSEIQMRSFLPCQSVDPLQYRLPQNYYGNLVQTWDPALNAGPDGKNKLLWQRVVRTEVFTISRMHGQLKFLYSGGDLIWKRMSRTKVNRRYDPKLHFKITCCKSREYIFVKHNCRWDVKSAGHYERAFRRYPIYETLSSR